MILIFQNFRWAHMHIIMWGFLFLAGSSVLLGQDIQTKPAPQLLPNIDSARKTLQERERLLLAEADVVNNTPAPSTTQPSTSEAPADQSKEKEQPTEEVGKSNFNPERSLISQEGDRALPVGGGNRVPFVISDGGLPRLFPLGLRLPYMDLRPDLLVSAAYNDNIFLRSGKGFFTREADYITTVSPRIAFTYGEDVQTEPDTTFTDFYYAPSFIFFADHTKEDGLNHDGSVQIGHRFSRLSLFAKEKFSQVTGGEIESGDLFNRRISLTDLSAEYELSPKTSMEWTGNIIYRDYDRGFDSLDAKTGIWFNYYITPKIKLGIGPNVGVVDVKNSVDQQYGRGLVRVVYSPSQKLSTYIETGVDYRHYNGSSDDTWNFVLRSGGTWALAAQTNIHFNINRYIQNSNTLRDQNQTISGFYAGIDHRFTKQVLASLGGGYENAAYSSTSSTTHASREDNFVSISPTLKISVKEWWDISGSYTYRRNMSNFSNNSFDNNVVNLSSTIRF